MLKPKNTRVVTSGLKLGVSAVALLGIMGAYGAAFAQEGQDVETVVVTGFRESLEKALDMKRANVEATDSILAEDIAKFPDLNVSESLQRIPGVAITRESGEGRQVTVRGLGAQFTRVRINGLETLTTTGGQDTNTSGGGTNRGRGFDFNVFASELFSQLTIRKSNSASVEEGSLGATVDLKTAHPFDYDGFVFTASGQYGYQEYGGGSSPRVAMLISDTFAGGRFGLLFSGAYAISNTLEEGTDNGRWVSDQNNTAGSHSTTWQFASVNGATSGSDFDIANTAFRPRFPRWAQIPLHTKRLGLTAAAQWQVDDATLITVDGLYADFAAVRKELYMEPYALSQASVSATNSYPRRSSGSGATALCVYAGETCSTYSLHTTQIYTHVSNLINFDSGDIDANNTLIRGDLTNVGLRSEQRLDHLDTRFMQVTVEGTHEFSNDFKLYVMGGWSESHHRNPIQTTLTADYGCIRTGTSACTTAMTAASGAGSAALPFQYDYTGGKIPLLNYGLADATDPTGWYLSQIRERAMGNFNAFRTALVEFEYKATNELKISGGASARNYGYNTFDTRRSRGSNTNLDAIIPYDIQSQFVANPSAFTQVTNLKALNTPAGSATSWFVPSIDKFNEAFSIWDQTVYPFADGYALGNCDSNGSGTETNDASSCGAFHMGIEPAITSTGNVHENDYGGWVQADWDTEISGIPFRGNIGVRYILTEQTAKGYTLNANGDIVSIEEKQVYHDWLPAVNMVVEPIADFMVRFNASYAMSRPNLTSLLPSASASVSGGNWTYNTGNPALKPSRSKNLDLAFEYYYGKGAMISVAGFYKHLDNIAKSTTTPINWATGTGDSAPSTYGLNDPSGFAAACGLTLDQWNSGMASSTCSLGNATTWNLRTTIDGDGAPLYGTEINWQQPFTFLPAPFDYFGLLANFTYAQAQQDYFSSGTNTYKADLAGLSRISYNATLYYDDTVFQARISAAFRSKFLISSTLNTLNLGTYSSSQLNVDASATYKWSENFTFTLDALNLTNQAMDIYVDRDTQRTNIYHKTGRLVMLGLRYSY